MSHPPKVKYTKPDQDFPIFTGFVFSAKFRHSILLRSAWLTRSVVWIEGSISVIDHSSTNAVSFEVYSCIAKFLIRPISKPDSSLVISTDREESIFYIVNGAGCTYRWSHVHKALTSSASAYACLGHFSFSTFVCFPPDQSRWTLDHSLPPLSLPLLLFKV